MTGIKKISTRIFLGIFTGTLIIFSLASVSDFLYSRKILSDLTIKLINRSFDAAYNRLDAQINTIISQAQNTAFYIVNYDYSPHEIAKKADFNFSVQENLLFISFEKLSLEDKKSEGHYCYVRKNAGSLTPFKYCSCPEDRLKSPFDSNSVTGLAIRNDTISLYYHFNDSYNSLVIRYDYDLNYFVSLLNEGTGLFDSRYYIFDRNANPVQSTTLPFSDLNKQELSDEISSIKSYVSKNRYGLIRSDETGSDRAYFIRRFNPLDITLVTSIGADIILKAYNRYFRITFLVTLLVIIVLAYVLQRIITRITRPITELTSISKKLQDGSLHTPIPDFNSSGETEQLSNALRSVQSRMQRYVSDYSSALREKRALEHELKIANRIQLDMIPQAERAYTNIPEFDLYAKMVPAKGVAGDFYNYFFIDDYQLFFVIGDVSGKGIPAALFMVKAITLIEVAIREYPDPARAFKAVNENLCLKNDEAMFVTSVCGIINIKTGQLTLCDAGHNTPMFSESGEQFEYHSINKGRPLGIIHQGNYSNTVVNLKEKDTLLLYTDGFPECVSADGGMLGEEPFLDAIKDSCSDSLMDVSERLWSLLSSFRKGAVASDDTTILILRYMGELD